MTIDEIALAIKAMPEVDTALRRLIDKLADTDPYIVEDIAHYAISLLAAYMPEVE